MLEPIVRQMILCEDARPRKGSRKKSDVFGVMSIVEAPADAFPIHLSFSVYLCLTDSRGSGQGAIKVVDEETDEPIYNGDAKVFRFGTDPMAIVSSTLWIPLCEFPRPTLYRVEFVYNDVAIASCPLLVREAP